MWFMWFESVVFDLFVFFFIHSFESSVYRLEHNDFCVRLSERVWVKRKLNKKHIAYGMRPIVESILMVIYRISNENERMTKIMRRGGEKEYIHARIKITGLEIQWNT